MNDVSSNFILDEENMEMVAETIKVNGNILENMINEYILVLTRAKMCALQLGKSAEAFSEYIEYVECLDQHMFFISRKVANICGDFVRIVDDTDKRLY